MMSGLVKDRTADPAVRRIGHPRLREPVYLKTAVYGRVARQGGNP